MLPDSWMLIDSITTSNRLLKPAKGDQVARKLTPNRQNSPRKKFRVSSLSGSGSLSRWSVDVEGSSSLLENIAPCNKQVGEEGSQARVVVCLGWRRGGGLNQESPCMNQGGILFSPAIFWFDAFTSILHTRNITSHSMKDVAFHSLLRRKMIILPILTSSLMHFCKSWENVLFELRQRILCHTSVAGSPSKSSSSRSSTKLRGCLQSSEPKRQIRTTIITSTVRNFPPIWFVDQPPD